MSKRFRMSTGALVARVSIPGVAVVLYSFSTPRPAFTVLLLGIPFSLAAILLWSANTIQLKKDRLIHTRWLFFNETERQLSSISELRLHEERSLFLSEPWIEIVFSGGQSIALMSFAPADLKQILDCVRKHSLASISPRVEAYISENIGPKK